MTDKEDLEFLDAGLADVGAALSRDEHIEERAKAWLDAHYRAAASIAQEIRNLK